MLHIGGRKNDEVVADGPYSLCRHPPYVGSALLFLSGALFLKSLVFAGAIGALAIIYFGLTVPAEEEALAARLGQPFTQYCRRVNRVWPSRGRFLTPRTLIVDLHSLYLEAARASRWVWLPLFGEIISHLRRMPWWPRLFHIL